MLFRHKLPVVNLGSGQTAFGLATGSAHTCVVLHAGAAKCWGESGAGRSGYDSDVDIGDGAGTSMASLPTVGLGLPVFAGQFFYDGFESGDTGAWSAALP